MFSSLKNASQELHGKSIIGSRRDDEAPVEEFTRTGCGGGCDGGCEGGCEGGCVLVSGISALVMTSLDGDKDVCCEGW